MRRPLGWLLFAIGGIACLIGMFGLMGVLASPIDLRVAVLENDSELIDWMIVWLVVWAAGLFMLAGKRKQPNGHAPGAD